MVQMDNRALRLSFARRNMVQMGRSVKFDCYVATLHQVMGRAEPEESVKEQEKARRRHAYMHELA